MYRGGMPVEIDSDRTQLSVATLKVNIRSTRSENSADANDRGIKSGYDPTEAFHVLWTNEDNELPNFCTSLRLQCAIVFVVATKYSR